MNNQSWSAPPQENGNRIASLQWSQSCSEIFRLFELTFRFAALYRIGHTVTIDSLIKTYEALEKILAEASAAKLTFTLSEGRWAANGATVSGLEEGPETFKLIFRNYGLRSLVFLKGIELKELSVFCELVSEAPQSGRYFSDILEQKGIHHIQCDAGVDTAGPKMEKKTPDSPAPSLSVSIKTLLEQDMGDSEKKSKVCEDVVSVMNQFIKERVTPAIRLLKRDKQQLSNEKRRMEVVLASIAEGKVIVDNEGNIVMMDPVAEKITGKPLAETLGKSLAASVRQEGQMMALSQDLKAGADQPISGNVLAVGGEEAMNALRNSTAIVKNVSGHVVGTYAVLPHAAKFKEASRLQEDFISNVTHELKAPLTAICSALELIRDQTGSPLGPAESNFLEISLKNSERLKEMINDMLDFSKIQSGKMAMRSVPVEAGVVLNEAVEGLSPWAKAKGVLLKAKPPEPEFPKVFADHSKTVQILTNLISNAIKFTEPNGKIEVSVSIKTDGEREHALFRVQDTGCGIAQENLDRIFEKFVQVAGKNGAGKGVGLGLTIANSMVELQGGSMRVESQPGQGSAFLFTLPLAPEAPAAVEAAPPEPKQESWQKKLKSILSRPPRDLRQFN